MNPTPQCITHNDKKDRNKERKYRREFIFILKQIFEMCVIICHSTCLYNAYLYIPNSRQGASIREDFVCGEGVQRNA